MILSNSIERVSQLHRILKALSQFRHRRTGLLLLTLFVWTSISFAQKTSTPRRLPSAEKVVDTYLKAIGGKRAVAALRDASYEWALSSKDASVGSALIRRKAPASERSEMSFGNRQIIAASNGTSAWEMGLDGSLQTLTGAKGAVAKLRALLNSTRLVNYKKSNVLARVVSTSDTGSEPVYVVEFSTRGGARLQYHFSIQSGLLVRVIDEVRKTWTSYEDYRPERGVLEPHRIHTDPGNGELTLFLQKVNYDTGLDDRIFEPPAASEALDVPALLREVGRNQDEVEKRIEEYAFTQKETDREINNKGEIKKETAKVYEVFPIANREPILKLISENGVVLSAERAAKEEKRILEEFEKAERDRAKDEREAAKRKLDRVKKNKAQGKEEDDDPEISQFLKVCEFVSPRRERFADRETIVFDFRPRPGFRPGNREESLIAKLVGAVWIDPVDKQVIRLEARLAEGFKIAGGLLVSLKPGAAIVMEQTRVADGVWLPRFAQMNLSVKVLLFGGGDYNKTIEWSDYRHFSGDVKDYKIDSPKVGDVPDKKP